MAKCEICRKKISETFMNKVLGTHVKDAKGKRHIVCSECQKKLITKERILEKITGK